MKRKVTSDQTAKQNHNRITKVIKEDQEVNNNNNNNNNPKDFKKDITTAERLNINKMNVEQE